MDLNQAAVELLLGTPQFRASEIAERAGIDLDEARRIWRAMGFAEPPDDEPFFTHSDLATLSTALEFIEAGHADRDLVVTMARVLSQAIAQAASAQSDVIRNRVLAADGGIDETEVPEVLKGLEEVLVHIWRRHLAAALESEAALGGSQQESLEQVSTIGFADLVGFTRLSRHMDEVELTRFVEDFDAKTQEIVSDVGGRVVKTIGDEVMFMMRQPAEAAEAALRMTDAFPDDDEPPTVRVGLATGEVVRYRGDFFGPVVNLASRAVGEARPGTVLTSEETREALKDEDTFAFKPLRPKRLKGVGLTRLWSLRRPD